MPAGHGLRSRTRDLFARPFTMKGYIPLSTYLRTFKIGDYVNVKVNGAIHKGMPHKFYHGRTGSVWNVTKGVIGVEINTQGFRHYSHAIGKRTCLIDTMTLARSLEGQGLPSKHAEAISLAIREAANATFEKVSDNFVKKTDQVLYASISQHDVENLGAHVKKIRTDLLYEMNVMGMKIDKLADVLNARLKVNDMKIDKLTDVLNARLEANNMKIDKSADMFNARLGAEICTMKHELITKLEDIRYDMIKYFVGTVVYVYAFNAAVIRYFVM